MLKLYKRIKRVLHYHEAWVSGSKLTEHWGIVGEQGESREHKRNKKLAAEADIERVLAAPLAAGYEPIDAEDQTILLIEYPVEGMGTTKDLDKRHALEDRMNETLGWTGLGNCDGGSMGSGTMEVCCYVVDFEVTKRVIENDLKGTEFGDYTRIYDESEGPSPVLTKSEPGTGMLVPPWIMHKDLARNDPGWRKGPSSDYLVKWTDWYRSAPEQTRITYPLVFREPDDWSGFYQSIES